MPRLTLEDRKTIASLYKRGQTAPMIADRLGCHFGTVYRELRRGCTGRKDAVGRWEYDPLLAERKHVKAAHNIGRWQRKKTREGI